MASKQKVFVENLQVFSKSLENIVELLQEQANSQKTDVFNSVLENLEGNKLGKIVQQLENLNKQTSDINSKVDDLIKMQKAAAKQKEAGLFDKIQDKANKSKIVDGIGVVMLIAGGVLAIGSAFKIVGKVDYKSVIALGAAIYLVAMAFKQVADIKGLTLKKVAVTGLAIVMMAAAVLGANQLLKYVTPINFFQLFTVLAISAAMGIATYLLLSAAAKMKLSMKDLAVVALLPLILPIIATSILLSSLILAKVEPLDFSQAIGVVITSLAIGLSLLAFAPTVKILGKMSLKDLLVGTLATVVVSLAIAASSHIIGLGNYGDHPSIGWSLGVGLSLLGFGLTSLALGAAIMLTGGLGAVAILAGAAAMLVIAATITGVSSILNSGKYGNYPGFGWAVGVGLSMLGFGTAMLGLGTLVLLSFGLGMKALDTGTVAVHKIARTIVSVAEILSKGSFEKYPTLGWSIGVGASMLGFGAAMLASGTLVLLSFGLGKKAFDAGADIMNKIAFSIVSVSKILASGTYTDGAYPSAKWASGVGGSIYLFAKSFALIMALNKVSKLSDSNLDFFSFVQKMGYAMVGISKILGEGSWETGYPTKDWAAGVGGSILAFAKTYEIANKMSLGDFSLGGKEDFVSFMTRVATGIVAVSKILATTEYTKFPTADWIGGISSFLNSLPDDKAMDKLEDFIDSLSDMGTSKFKKSVDNITYLATAISALSTSLDSLQIGNKLKFLQDMTGSMLTISVIDQSELKRTLNTLEDKSSKLTQIFDKGSFIDRLSTSVNTAFNPNVGPSGKESGAGQVGVKVAQVGPSYSGNSMDKLVYYTQNIDKNLQTIVDKETSTDPAVSSGKDVRESK